MKSISKIWPHLLMVCSLSTASIAHSNVVMTGTRIIYPAEQQEKTLQFSNNANQSSIVQIWVDKDNPQSTPETADGPFVINPQVFRINPNHGQMVRMIYVGVNTLPQDRESIFYLNFKQIPALEKNKLDQNRLVLLVKSRIKIFYRPKTIIGQPEDSFKNLTYTLIQNKSTTLLEVNNPSGYYINPTQAIIKNNALEYKALDVNIIPPKSTVRWKLNKEITQGSVDQVILRLVNDYGSYMNQQIKPKQQSN
ncbi:molecular chaperone [Acinetobacter sp.]|uniref:fimbrial biogenesis chaperone n=1 Tax=Acinetobacter sp. TaxID=472 RepID=UPI0031D86677